MTLNEAVEEPQLRWGIMGGTFDPIHLGHLFCAEQARIFAHLDRVIFIPAGDPAFKQGTVVASARERLEMCQLAVSQNPFFEVSAIEVERSGITYTVDTIAGMQQTLPSGVKLSLIIGSDTLCALDTWRDADTLAHWVDFIVVLRPDVKDIADQVKRLQNKGFTLNIVEAPLLDISSSEIRERVERNISIRYLCPAAVCDYIDAGGLYHKEGKSNE